MEKFSNGSPALKIAWGKTKSAHLKEKIEDAAIMKLAGHRRGLLTTVVKRCKAAGMKVKAKAPGDMVD